MKNLVRIMTVIFCVSIAVPSNAQLDVIRKARKKVEKRTGDEVDKKVDEKLDKVFGTKNNADPAKADTKAGTAASPSGGLRGKKTPQGGR